MTGWAFPIAGLDDGSVESQISTNGGGLKILDELQDRFSDPPLSPSPLSRREFAETLTQSRALYRAALSRLPQPLTSDQRRQFEVLAVRCFSMMRRIGPEFARTPINVEDGTVMHLTLILGASMKVAASTASPDALELLPLLREQADQSARFDEWIAAAHEQADTADHPTS